MSYISFILCLSVLTSNLRRPLPLCFNSVPFAVISLAFEGFSCSNLWKLLSTPPAAPLSAITALSVTFCTTSVPHMYCSSSSSSMSMFPTNTHSVFLFVMFLSITVASIACITLIPCVIDSTMHVVIMKTVCVFSVSVLYAHDSSAMFVMCLFLFLTCSVS